MKSIIRTLACAVIAALFGAPAWASTGELRSSLEHCAAVSEKQSRHVSEVCFDYKLAYSLSILLGEPVVESRASWNLKTVSLRNGRTTGQIVMTGLVYVPQAVRDVLGGLKPSQLKISARLDTSAPLWMHFDPGVLKKSGAGFSFNTSGSPAWSALFTNGAEACDTGSKLAPEEAKRLTKAGITLSRPTVCAASFGGLAALDRALEATCMVETVKPCDAESQAKKKDATGQAQDNAPAAPDPLASALEKALTGLDGELAAATADKEAAGTTVDKERGADGGAAQAPAVAANLPADLRAEAEQRLAARRAAVSDNYKSALAACENSKPRRPMEKVEGLRLTSQWRGCDNLRGDAWRACKARFERNVERAKAAEAERKRREREEFEESLAAYEREIAVWPQTLATCKAGAESDHAQAIRNYGVAVAAEAARIRDIRKMGDETLDALTKALKSAN